MRIPPDDPYFTKETIPLTSAAMAEPALTGYLQEHFAFVAFDVSEKADQLRLESRMITTIRVCDDCSLRMRDSGPWLVHKLFKRRLTPENLQQLAATIR